MKKITLIFVLIGLINIPNVLQGQAFSKFFNVPFGIQRNVRGVDYELTVTKLEFHPTGTKMDLLLSVTMPYKKGDTSRLHFAATGVKWSEQGGFADEKVRLALLDDFCIPLGKHIEIVLKKAVKNSGTFAEIDCRGFKQFSLDASLVFDNFVAIPANCDTLPCRKLSADFRADIETWSDLIVSLNLPAFQVPTLKDWVFQAEQVVFDFSENRKSDLAKLPKSYLQTYFPNDENLWRGVFIKSLKVALPKSFEGRERFEFQAQSLIIDEMGVTGTLSAKHVIPNGLAHINGWGLSVDTLGLEFLTNRLKSGYFDGLLQLPITDTALKYNGNIFENNRYLMQVYLGGNLQFDCWKTASVKLNKESFIKMELVEKQFFTQAVLHGEMGFETFSKTTKSSNILSVPSVSFENLVLQNRKPYFTVGKLSYNGSIGISGFPAQIKSLGIQSIGDDSIAVNCVASIGLTNANDGGFEGQTDFSIRSHLETKNNRHRWVYDGFSLNNIFINIDEHAFSLKGGLAIFENDSLYGQGFSGRVELKIKQPNITVATAATFGKTNDFRYWYADGLVNLGEIGIPIFSGLSLNGFGGGAYQRMKPLFGEKSTSSIGVSSSGIKYIPDISTKFGIQASVAISAQSNSKVFNGQIGLELSFNTSGGLNFIQLKGSAKIAQALSSDYFNTLKKNIELLGSMDKNTQEKLRKEAAKDAAITACLTLNYDFNNDVFRGLFDAEISAPLLKGNGQAELYLSSSKWFLHIGHPDRRFKVNFGVGDISLNTGVYLMAGHDIPNIPKPPATITNFISKNDFSSLEQSRSRDISSINSGKGFIFGSDFSINTGNLKYLMFFAQFQTQLGFDFMLKDYGNLPCAHRTSPLGINGWYGNGHAYAYLAGRLGLEARVFGRKRQFTILDAKVGTLLQAQLPNPVWFSGNLAANYNILNGLIKGKCNFKFEFGEKCELPKLSQFNELPIITDIKPSQNETGVSVYTLPQAAFSMPIKEFQVNTSETYKIELESFTLKSGNTVLASDLEWNDDRTSAILKPHDILPSQTTLTASVTLRFLEKNNGVWKPLLDEKNQPQKETLSRTFKTGNRPETLPIADVLYSYPVIEQRNFYLQESSEGYIQLSRNYGFLFDVANYDYFVRFETSKGVDFSQKMTYSATTKRIEWTIPKLNAQTDYTVKIVGEPRKTSKSFANISEDYISENFDDDENSAEIRKTTISKASIAPQTVEIFAYTFRTSAYSTFAEAIKSLTLQKASLQTLLAPYNGQYFSIPDAYYLFTSCHKVAGFDEAELFGTTYTQDVPLIKATALLDPLNNYFSISINPLIYYAYNYGGLVKLPRNSGQSLLPTWAMEPLKLATNSKTFPWTYDPPLVYRNDLHEIQLQLAEQHAKGKNIANYSLILYKSMPIPISGTYRFSLQYCFPNGKLGTSHTLYFDYAK